MKTNTARAPQHSDERLNPYAIPLPRRAEYDIRNYEFFETMLQAKREKRLRIKRLKKALKAEKYQDAIDEIKSALQSLERCCKGNRCCAPICPVCWRRHRINFVHLVLEFMDRKKYTHFAFVTLVDGKWHLPSDELHRLRANPIRSQTYYRLNLTGFAGRFVAIGLVDVKMQGDFWNGHMHFLVPYREEDRQELDEVLEVLRDKYFQPDMHPCVRIDPMHVEHQCLKKVRHTRVCRITSYTMKRYWALIKIIGTAKYRCSLTEPHFTDHLLWLQKCRMFDLRLVFGACMGRCIEQNC